MQDRLIEVEWEDTSNTSKEYDAEIEVYGYDRSALLNDILQAASSQNHRIINVEAHSNKEKTATIRITVSIKNLSHLQSIVDKIKQVPDIYSVHRLKG